MTVKEEFRDSLVAAIQQELVGPMYRDKPDQLDESPVQRYCAGILFPQAMSNTELEVAGDEKDDSEINESKLNAAEAQEGSNRKTTESGKLDDGAADNDTSVQLANTFLPSAMGLSFIVAPGTRSIEILAEASTYSSQKGTIENKEQFRVWNGVQLKLAACEFSPNASIPIERKSKAIASNLELRILSRSKDNGTFLITVTMVNTFKAASGGLKDANHCFFQCGFKVRAPDSSLIFVEYESLKPDPLDDEEASLRLLYRQCKTFGVGHGVAVEWSIEQQDRVGEIWTSTIPVAKVAPFEPKSGLGNELNMWFLSGANNTVSDTDILDSLRILASEYRSWIENLEQSITGLLTEHQNAAQRHMKECRLCLLRIEQGIELLVNDQGFLFSFKLTNLSMLMQQIHSRRERRTIDDKWEELPSNYINASPKIGRWRAFQLAFILMNIPAFSSNNEISKPCREMVDLIWFPTGGGKTEAYLGLTAFSIISRRLKKPSNIGCTVLMRYTLRLLTSQQFQRAASLICALESIRKQREDQLGTDSISIGLWIGGDSSPNKRADALLILRNMVKEKRYYDSDVENPFQLLTCPWCGTALDEHGSYGYVVAGSPKTVRMVCPERRCPFSTIRHALPVSVIDEDIYDAPPSLIIGTVDKFAMLAWYKEAGAIFGRSHDHQSDPPDLIIQDELHLISGPLGSLVGIYEAAIDLLSSWNNRRPKVVASTATIRRAATQCEALYDRKTFQFPPAGLSMNDSFFAKENTKDPGRFYVGVFASGAPSFVTTQVRTFSSVLQACRHIDIPVGETEAMRDSYWTLLAYFNSLRELGHAATLVQADILEFMWTIASRLSIPKEKCRRLGEPVELTSRQSAEEIPDILERLKITYPQKEKGSPWPIDVVLASSMVSVGVDVSRLGLMAIVGQPKTTSEYIQASSRVGRASDAPGLILTLLNPGKPRDRSHYEHFKSFHGAFYSFVEPTSVTPFSIPVIDRALHALIVIIARHLGEVDEPKDLEKRLPEVQKGLDLVMKRVSRIDKDHSPYFESKLKDLVRKWKALKPAIWGGFGPPADNRPLMYPSGSQPKPEWAKTAWPTPSSLRNVDVECIAEVISDYPSEEDK